MEVAMVALPMKSCPRSSPAWHAGFHAKLPIIARHAKVAFRHLDPEARAEAVQKTICNACVA